MKFLQLLHLNIRKKQIKDENKKSSKDKFVYILDDIVLLLAFVMPLTFIPQIIKMHVTQSVTDISLTTYISLLALTLPWVLYGMVHKEKVIILNNFMWLVVHLSIIISYFIYV
jgi:uncharacterized protein with PQ loop repeat